MEEKIPQSNTAGPEKDKEGKEKLSLRILVAEDYKDIRNMVKEMLEDKGYVVEAVENGQLLLDKLATGEFDLIITDQNMPVMKGIEVLKKIRATEKTKNLPVIVFSNDETLQGGVEKLGGIFCDKGHPDSLFTMVEKIFEDIK